MQPEGLVKGVDIGQPDFIRVGWHVIGILCKPWSSRRPKNEQKRSKEKIFTNVIRHISHPNIWHDSMVFDAWKSLKVEFVDIFGVMFGVMFGVRAKMIKTEANHP